MDVQLKLRWTLRSWRQGAAVCRAQRERVCAALGLNTRHALRKAMHVSAGLWLADGIAVHQPAASGRC